MVIPCDILFILKFASFFFKSKNWFDKNFVLGIKPRETTSNNNETKKVIGKNIFNIFIGFNPKEVITVSSYSLESLAKVITIERKNEIGIV